CYSYQFSVNHQRPHRGVKFGHQLRQRVLRFMFLLRNLFQPRLLLAGFRDVASDELFRIVLVLQLGVVFSHPFLFFTLLPPLLPPPSFSAAEILACFLPILDFSSISFSSSARIAASI